LAAVMMDVPALRWKRRGGLGIFGATQGGAAALPQEDSMTDDRYTQTYAPWAALLLRVSLGVLFLAHGALLKLGTFGLAGTMGFFGSIGYPPVFGAIVTFAEIAGGIALILGVWVRAVSLLFLPILIGATIQHLPNGWGFGSPGGGWEFPAFWTVTLLVQAGLGAGALALDPNRLLGRGPAGATAEAH
jgi:putative oxidoreductase